MSWQPSCTGHTTVHPRSRPAPTWPSDQHHLAASGGLGDRVREARPSDGTAAPLRVGHPARAGDSGVVKGSGGEEDDQGTASAIRGLLLCIPGNDDLRLLRAAVYADPTQQPWTSSGPCARTLPTWTTGMNRGWRYVALVDVRPQDAPYGGPSSHRAPGEPLAAPPAVRRDRFPP